MADNAAALAQDEPFYKIFRIVLTYQCCLFAVALYDWLLSLPKEWRYIWKSQFTVVSALYVGLRYFEMVRSAITIYLANSMIPVGQCAPWARWQVYSAMVAASMVFALFTLRASALYGNSKIVLGFLATLGLSILALEGVASPQFGTIPYATGRGPCFAGATPTSSNILVIFWLGPFVFDAVTTLLLITRVVLIRKRGGSDSSMVRLLARDGLLYFFIISSANLINVGFYLGAREDIRSINSAMAYAVTSVMSSRLILSLRHHAYKQEHLATLPASYVFSASKNAALSNAFSHTTSDGGRRGSMGVRKHGSDEELGMEKKRMSGEVRLDSQIALADLSTAFKKTEDEYNEPPAHLPPAGRVIVRKETRIAVDDRKD